MRPLEAPKKRPRTKNVFDRLKEKLLRSAPSLTSSEDGDEEEPEANMLERVQEAKLAREQALRDAEEGESDIGSGPPSRRSSRVQGKSRNSSIITCNMQQGHIPQIIVEDAGEDDGEKSTMIPNGNSENKKVECETNEQKPAMNGFANELSSNMERELLLANTDLKNVQNGLLSKPEEVKVKSLSTANVWGLAPRKRSMPPGIAKEDYARPLYRRDIFYSGSILHISEFRSQPNFKQYVASITAIPNELPPEKESTFWKSLPIPKAAKDILKQMLDLSLLKVCIHSYI